MLKRWILGLLAVVAMILVGREALMAQRHQTGPVLAVGNPSGWKVAGDDPMEAVENFLIRNRSEADESIHVLEREAETLRARLQKVETALARWRAVAQALNSDKKLEAPPLPDPGPQLEQIKPTGPFPQIISEPTFSRPIDPADLPSRPTIGSQDEPPPVSLPR